MRRALVLFLFTLSLTLFLQAEEFQSFTGKITRNKVRMRIQPTLEARIIRELQKNDLIVAIGEVDDFYVVKAPEDLKAFVFRTYVLDDAIEGKHVNVRSEPDLEATVIAQLNSGDKVRGTISPLNSKWLEISPPESAKFYVCKEYVEKMGDSNLMTQISRRKEEVNLLLNRAYQQSQEELNKSFDQMAIDGVVADLQKVVSAYSDFPDQAARAKELLNTLQEHYLEKKLAYLEARSQTLALVPAPIPQQTQKPAVVSRPVHLQAVSAQAAAWIPLETTLYQQWAADHGDKSPEEYYQQQKQEAVLLKGIIEPYMRAVRNKPGDYLLVSKNTRLPSAYLYSTKVDLQTRVGQEVTLMAVPRPNNNFAHPAYFVLTIE